MNTSPIVEHIQDSTPSSAKTIGLMLLESGKISAQDAERVIKLQKEENLRFGEAAVKLGLVQEADIQHMLARQFDYPYLSPGEGGFSKDLVAAYHPFSPQVESLRALRSQLMLRWFDDKRRVLTLVGANPGDGTSYLAANLGIVFSQLGERTLLIDANLRTPQLHTYFNLDNKAGLSDILAERATLAALTRIPQFVDLSVLTAGTQPPNPSELLARSNLGDLIALLSRHYDVILIDTPPAEQSADFQAVSANVGGALISVRKNRTRLNEVAAIKDMLAAAGAEVVGAVINAH
ncbi:MAG: chain length determinant protein tyrosine kinase EpsG [Thiobacillaceae bacterium]